jgi:hypothetical protein
VNQQATFSLMMLLGGQVSTTVLVMRHPLAAPPGREAVLLPDAKARETLLGKLGEWRVRLVLAAGDGERYDLVRDGTRHVTLGRDADQVDAAIVAVEGSAVTDTIFLSARRLGRLDVVSPWRRLRAIGEEHTGIGQRLAAGTAGVAGALAGLWVAFIRILRRRNNHGPERPAGGDLHRTR